MNLFNRIKLYEVLKKDLEVIKSHDLVLFNSLVKRKGRCLIKDIISHAHRIRLLKPVETIEAEDVPWSKTIYDRQA